MALHFFELPKLPKEVSVGDGQRLWLKLFDADTEEELKQIEALGASVMNEAIGAYRSITATEEFRRLAQMREDARHNEASALHNARNEGQIEGRREGQIEGRREESEKWRKVVEKKDTIFAAVLAEKDAALVNKNAALATKDAEIARLRELIGGNR
jgi:predicted transposase/invertase (TIGR01784 family)